jgi:hypothetical protein
MEGTAALAASIHSLEGRRKAAEMAVAAQRLSVLDDVWTTYLAAADPQNAGEISRDLPQLEQLVAEMQGGLSDVGERAREFQFLFEEATSAEVDEALSHALAAQSLPEQPLREQLAPLQEEGDFRGAVLSGCIYIVRHAQEESDLLGEKLGVLQRGEFTPGDFRFPFKCALFVTIAGAAIAAAWLPPVGAAVTTAAGLVVGPIASWQDCRDKWREIRNH